MKGYLYIETNRIGEINLEIIDESMGVIGGILITNSNYEKYQTSIQQQCIIKRNFEYN